MRLHTVFVRALPQLYKRHKQQHVDLGLANCLATARHTIRTTRYCFLISYGQSGWASTRLVEPIADLDAFAFWVGTSPNLRKVAEVTDNPNVTLAFGNMREQAVIVYGTATLLRDPLLKQRFWKGSWRLFFPEGPRSDAYVVIHVVAHRIELMSFRRNVVAEPFGLRPVVLVSEGGRWRIECEPPSECLTTPSVCP